MLELRDDLIKRFDRPASGMQRRRVARRIRGEGIARERRGERLGSGNPARLQEILAAISRTLVPVTRTGIHTTLPYACK